MAGDLVLGIGADSSELRAELAAMEAAVKQAADATKTSGQTMEKALNATQAATVKVTDEEKRWIAQTVAGKAAAEAKAKALGLTTSQLKAMEVELRRAAEAEREAVEAAKAAAVAESAAKEKAAAEAAAATEAEARARKEATDRAAAERKAFQDLVDETEEVSRSSRRAAFDMRGLGGAAEWTGQASAKMRGILSTVSPELGEVAGFVNDAADALEVGAGASTGFGAVLRALPGPLLAVGVAAFEVKGVIDDYTAAKRAATHADEAFRLAQLPLREALESAKKEQELLNRAIESGDPQRALELAELAATADTKFADATKHLREEQEQLKEVLAVKDEGSFDGQIALNRYNAIEAEIAVLRQDRNELFALAIANKSARDVIAGTTDAIDDQTRAVEENGKALAESKAVQIAELRASLASRRAARQEEIDAKKNADDAEGAAIMAKVQEEQEARKKAAKATADAEAEIQRRKNEEIASLQSEAADLIVGNLADIAEAHKDSSAAAFGFYKAATVAQIAMDTQKGIMAAVANFTPIPVVGPALAAAAATAIGAAGASAAGKVLAEEPSFADTPQVMKMQRGGTVRFADDDVFAAAKDPNDLRRQVGMATGGEGGTVRPYVLKLGHKVMHATMRDNVRLNGPLQRAIESASGRTAGHRQRSR